MNIPRPEHPKPQFQRDSWLNLNGQWDFEIDNSRSGEARGLSKTDAKLSGTITVPFCPESELSGVNNKDFMLGLWYQRTVELTEEQCAGRVFIHFGAVDNEAVVYINGKKVGSHKGGYISFKLEITEYVTPGVNVITVNALDDNRDPLIPSGKQCYRYGSYGCFYSRTSGIWQTVWLEFTPKDYVQYVKYDTNAENAQVVLTVDMVGCADLTANITYEGKPMGCATMKQVSGQQVLTVQLAEKHLWEPGAGRLYDVELTYGQDKVQSYFGLRSLRLDGFKFRINEKTVFQRLILDQGFYPDGIYTAPSDEALVKDIQLSLDMGFNGARPHEKIFEERYLYHCDRMGYIVWGEFPNWGLYHNKPEAIYSFLPQWLEELKRDYNHPAIVGWCPFNETWNKIGHRQYDDLIRMAYRVTKAVDPYRPCIDTSGNFHVETDIFDVHDYDQNPVTFKEHYDKLMTEGDLYDMLGSQEELIKHPDSANRQFYTGGPTFVSEYGGIRWAAGVKDESRQGSWGYGEDVKGMEDFKYRFKGLTDALLDNHCMLGFCYTQLTDVEQEQNGLYTYDRVAKFDPEWIKSVVSRKAAIEE